jgi:hypothetical protein
MYACGSSMHQKCSNYALTNLFFGLCKSLWIIDPFIICPSLHLGAPTCLSTLEMLQIREHTLTPSSSIVFIFGFTFKFFKECGGASCSNNGCLGEDMILRRTSTKWWFHPPCYWNVWVSSFSFWFIFDGCKFFKVYQNLITLSPFSAFFI